MAAIFFGVIPTCGVLPYAMIYFGVIPTYGVLPYAMILFNCIMHMRKSLQNLNVYCTDCAWLLIHNTVNIDVCFLLHCDHELIFIQTAVTMQVQAYKLLFSEVKCSNTPKPKFIYDKRFQYLLKKSSHRSKYGCEYCMHVLYSKP